MTVSHSSRLAGLKDYISQREIRLALPARRAAMSGEGNHTPGRSTIQNWSHWASQKIRGSSEVTIVDEVHLFPGWATKQLRKPRPGEPDRAFDVILHVSGFATSRRTPELLTRSQRAFLRLAKSFACIPQTQLIPRPTDTELQDFPELLHLPPRPGEISDDFEVENLDAYFRNSGNHSQEMEGTHFTSQLAPADPMPAEMARLHENLESRLKLFWASSLSSRRIDISIFLHSPDPKHHRRSLEFRPLLTREMLTGPDGHFSGTFRIDWKDIYIHTNDTLITSNQAREHELLVEARVINTERTAEIHETPTSILHIPITHSIIRVISDIDDTVRISRVVDGARAVFNQVFVKNLEDSIISEMGEWYGMMWERGVRFHYVSNGPFELLPLINQFIGISKLPLGSIRLRSYAGRSLFNGLLSTPSTRKKRNVIEVLDHFLESQFFLIGDSGEQDLELYSLLAADRPSQVAGVFIRNVSSVGLEDPTGIKADSGLTRSATRPRSRGTLSFSSSIPPRIVPKRAASDTEISPTHTGAIYIPRPARKGSLLPTSFSLEPSPDPNFMSRVSEDSSSSVASAGSSMTSSSRLAPQVWSLTEGERKRCNLQNRVYKARSMMPSHVVLRVFEDPKECVEAEEIIQRLVDVC